MPEMQASGELRVSGFAYEVDNYSIVDGRYTEDFDRAGGSVVLRGQVGPSAVTVTVSAADLQQALGRALVVLLGERPDAGVTAVAVTGYLDSEAGTYIPVDRVETRD